MGGMGLEVTESGWCWLALWPRLPAGHVRRRCARVGLCAAWAARRWRC